MNPFSYLLFKGDKVEIDGEIIIIHGVDYPKSNLGRIFVYPKRGGGVYIDANTQVKIIKRFSESFNGYAKIRDYFLRKHFPEKQIEFINSTKGIRNFLICERKNYTLTSFQKVSVKVIDGVPRIVENNFEVPLRIKNSIVFPKMKKILGLPPWSIYEIFLNKPTCFSPSHRFLYLQDKKIKIETTVWGGARHYETMALTSEEYEEVEKILKIILVKEKVEQ